MRLAKINQTMHHLLQCMSPPSYLILTTPLKKVHLCRETPGRMVGRLSCWASSRVSSRFAPSHFAPVHFAPVPASCRHTCWHFDAGTQGASITVPARFWHIAV